MNAHIARIKILSGFRAGAELVFRSAPVTVGRHSEAHLQFDPGRDLEVSTRHAVLGREGQRWYVKDLGSQNGTFINGNRVQDIAYLESGDILRFGGNGPQAVFDSELGQPSVGGDPGFHEAPATASSPPQDAGQLGVGGRPKGVTQIILAEVASRTKRLRYVVAALALALVTVVVGSSYLSYLQSGRWGREMAAMQTEIDSILDASARLQVGLSEHAEGLQAALEESQEQLREVRARLTSAQESGARPDVAELRRELLAAQAALRRQQLASNVDYDAIERAVGPAIARIFVELESGTRIAATAFAIHPTGLLVTNKHVVQGESGGAYRRIGVQFADSRQVFPAEVVAVAAETDLALIQVQRLLGEVPTVGPISEEPDTIPPGSPVAVLGFPLAGGPVEDSRNGIPRAVLSAGLLASAVSDFIEVEAFGAEGSSGSPILDRDGQVIGVLFGGRTEDGQQRLVGVSASEILALIRAAG